VGWQRFHFDAINSANIDPYHAPETPPEDLACYPLCILLKIPAVEHYGVLMTLEAEFLFAK
jgi:hypothetical protein